MSGWDFPAAVEAFSVGFTIMSLLLAAWDRRRRRRKVAAPLGLQAARIRLTSAWMRHQIRNDALKARRHLDIQLEDE